MTTLAGCINPNAESQAIALCDTIANGDDFHETARRVMASDSGDHKVETPSGVIVTFVQVGFERYFCSFDNVEGRVANKRVSFLD